MEIIVILLLTLAMAAANGANDNGKGIATLAGAGVTSYRKALWWAHGSTLAGALLSIVLAPQMLKLFSIGIISVKPTLAFTLAVLVGASFWVGMATLFRLPVSTTHALVGSMVGAGLVFAPGNVALVAIMGRVALPLLLSIGVSYTLSAILNRLLIKLPECTCIGPVVLDSHPVQFAQLTIVQADIAVCRAHSSFIGMHINHLHWFSSGLVGFARGLNDTPKIVAIPIIVVGAAGFPSFLLFALVAVAMCLGGMVASKRVAKRMGDDIIKMSHREGTFANLSTSVLITLGANMGWPMSTTHVSTGAITGIARTNIKRLNRKTMRDFVLTWTVTPFMAGLISAIAYYLST